MLICGRDTHNCKAVPMHASSIRTHRELGMERAAFHSKFGIMVWADVDRHHYILHKTVTHNKPLDRKLATLSLLGCFTASLQPSTSQKSVTNDMNILPF